ncbi:hypothetical protein L915_00393 [Phytophthora nicotianae]|nr:hypothetical protein L915_00393 [Phytophthora nicotianae]
MYRPGGDHLPLSQTWERLYRMVPINVQRMEDKPLSEMQFVKLLGLEPEYDAAEEISSNEFALLKELRSAQLASKRPWAECATVATVLFNTAVLQLTNPCLDLKKRNPGCV